jgi:hypothetical protein
MIPHLRRHALLLHCVPACPSLSLSSVGQSCFASLLRVDPHLSAGSDAAVRRTSACLRVQPSERAMASRCRTDGVGARRLTGLARDATRQRLAGFAVRRGHRAYGTSRFLGWSCTWTGDQPSAPAHLQKKFTPGTQELMVFRTVRIVTTSCIEKPSTRSTSYRGMPASKGKNAYS